MSYCGECQNSGVIDCYCGGDMCVCGEQEVLCPVCGGLSSDMAHDEQWEDDPDLGMRVLR